MWIIPNNLHTSVYVPDTEALTLDYNELSAMSEQSLLARSKPSLARTWLRRWKKGALNRHLYGRTLKPSHGGVFKAKWTSSLEASLANHSQQQETAKGQKTHATSSPTSPQELALFDPQSFSSKTSKALLVAERSTIVRSSKDIANNLLKGWEKAGEVKCSASFQKDADCLFSNMSSANWNNWVTTQRQSRLQRQKSAHRINETDGLLLPYPTPSVSDTEGGSQASRVEWTDKGAKLRKKNRPHVTFGAKLRDAVESWPTIATSDARTGYQNRSNGKKGTQKNLETVVRDGLQDQTNPNTAGNSQESWSTPQTRDFRTGEKERYEGKRSNHSKNLNDQVATTQNWQTPTVVQTNENPESFMARKKKNGYKNGTKIASLQMQVNWGDLKVYAINPTPSNGKLNPRWVEQLMGLEVGWCKPSADATNRTDELRLLGNGVVPQTAALAIKLALKELLTHNENNLQPLSLKLGTN